MPNRVNNLNQRPSTVATTSTANYVDELDRVEARWFAVRVSSRHEKKAARALRIAGVECYIPLRQKTAHYTRKTVVRELPLLTGYVFVRITRAQELTVLRTHYTAGFVKIGRDRRRVTEKEIKLLRRISSDRQLDWFAVEEAFDFREGTPVEILKGPLAGVRGIYLHKKSKKSFVISLGGLGACLATCEVDPAIWSPQAPGPSPPPTT